MHELCRLFTHIMLQVHVYAAFMAFMVLTVVPSVLGACLAPQVWAYVRMSFACPPCTLGRGVAI